MSRKQHSTANSKNSRASPSPLDRVRMHPQIVFSSRTITFAKVNSEAI
jgi:hypothetical protein